MKRLCIFVTYDSEKIVDNYIGYMLQELRKIVDYLVVICNYEGIVKGIGNIQSYADKVFYRKNIGFDAGAYKDALYLYLGWYRVSGFDELLLVNDSFYGPMYPLEDFFERMNGINADYWGLTRCPEVEFSGGYICESHIQSYFLVFRNNVIQSKEFRLFWENMPYAKNLTQAIVLFEIGINRLMRELNFIGMAAMDLYFAPEVLVKNENPYILYPLELIRDARIPVLKRKSLSLGNRGFYDAMEALKFIENECKYDISLLENHLRRIGKGTNIMGLDKFYSSHSRIYIYGAGLYGKNMAMYFRYRGWTFEKFLVTNLVERSEDCISFEDADIAEEDGIIIAVGNKKVFSEIVSLVKKKCGNNQIFNTGFIIW